MGLKQTLSRAWHFIWDDDSIWSWLANIVLAFVLIKFIVYPGLGFALQTTHPIVAVVSGSMEHKTAPYCTKEIQQPSFTFGSSCSSYSYVLCGKAHTENQDVDLDFFWKDCGSWYEENTLITQSQFASFLFPSGFNKGDIIVLRGVKPQDLKNGDILVFQSLQSRPGDPIIHRVVGTEIQDGRFVYSTKGDHNSGFNTAVGEESITHERSIGYGKYGKVSKAVFRLPYLGYVKIIFVELIVNPFMKLLR